MCGFRALRESGKENKRDGQESRSPRAQWQEDTNTCFTVVVSKTAAPNVNEISSQNIAKAYWEDRRACVGGEPSYPWLFLLFLKMFFRGVGRLHRTLLGNNYSEFCLWDGIGISLGIPCSKTALSWELEFPAVLQALHGVVSPNSKKPLQDQGVLSAICTIVALGESNNGNTYFQKDIWDKC